MKNLLLFLLIVSLLVITGCSAQVDPYEKWRISLPSINKIMDPLDRIAKTWNADAEWDNIDITLDPPSRFCIKKSAAYLSPSNVENELAILILCDGKIEKEILKFNPKNSKRMIVAGDWKIDAPKAYWWLLKFVPLKIIKYGNPHCSTLRFKKIKIQFEDNARVVWVLSVASCDAIAPSYDYLIDANSGEPITIPENYMWESTLKVANFNMK